MFGLLPGFVRPSAFNIVGTVRDDFNRADGALGTASDGQAWTTQGTWVVSANKAGATTPGGSGGSCRAYRSTAPTGLNYLIGTTLNHSRQAGMCFRVQDENNYWAFFLDSGGISRLYKFIASVATLVASNFTSGYTTNEAGLLVQVSNNGTSGDIVCSIKGTPVISRTAEAELKGETLGGLYVNNPAAAPGTFFDNFTADAF